MQSHFLIGPDIGYNTTSTNLNLIKIKNIFKKNNNSLKIYGDTENAIDCNNIKLPKNAHVIINAHGDTDKNGLNYRVNLCSLTYDFSKTLKEISKNKIINLELFSCYGGAAIYDIKALPKWSIIMTFTSPYHPSLGSLNNEIITKSSAFIYQDNPFIKFASYIFTNPDDTKFAINIQGKNQIFTSLIGSLDEFIKKSSSDEIIKWQNNQLDRFLGFCHDIQNDMNEQRHGQIDMLFKLFEDSGYRENWPNQFNIKRYQELLLINMSKAGELELVKKLLNFKLDINAKSDDGDTAVRIAAVQGHIKVFNELIKAGASVNEIHREGLSTLYATVRGGKNVEIIKELIKIGSSVHEKNMDGFSMVMTAANEGHADILRELINAGASVHEKSNQGFSALHMAANRGHLNASKELIIAGASVNEKTNNNLFIIDVAAHKEMLEIVKLLLASGVNTEESNIYKISKSKKILKEVKLYNKNPIQYILTHNEQTKLSLIALKNLENQDHLVRLLPKILKVENCLTTKPEGVIEDLNAICGDNGSYYDGYEL